MKPILLILVLLLKHNLLLFYLFYLFLKFLFIMYFAFFTTKNSILTQSLFSTYLTYSLLYKFKELNNLTRKNTYLIILNINYKKILTFRLF